jgi:hypothetical protein
MLPEGEVVSNIGPRTSAASATTVAPEGPTRPDDDLNMRREWRLILDGQKHDVVILYAVLSGFMSIEVDGTRVARAWREWQTVVGGANLGTAIGTHALSARVTQAFGTQTYRVSLSLDGENLPGSEAQPTPRQVGRRTVGGIAGLATVVAVITLVGRFPLIAAVSAAVGVLCVRVIATDALSTRVRALLVLSLIVGWVVAMRILAVTIYQA